LQIAPQLFAQLCYGFVTQNFSFNIAAGSKTLFQCFIALSKNAYFCLFVFEIIVTWLQSKLFHEALKSSQSDIFLMLAAISSVLAATLL
jgi:hypothetical protein